MKKIINITILSFFALQVYCQKNTILCGKVTSDKPFIIQIFEPLNGYHNITYIDTLPVNNALINAKDSIYKSIKISSPTFINILFKYSDTEFINRADVLIFPGDSVNMHFNLNIQNLTWIDFKGSNAAGQKLFNEINYEPYPKFIPIFEALNRLPKNSNSFIKEIDNAVAKNANLFNALSNKGLVSMQFAKTMEKCFKMLFYGQVISKFISDYPQREVLNKNKRDSIVEVFTSRLPGTDTLLKGLYNSYLYLTDYFEYITYRKYKLKKTEDFEQTDKEFVSNGKKYTIIKDFALVTYIEDKRIMADQWALELLNYFYIFPANYDESLINQYCSIYPHNKWENILRRKYPTSKNINYTLQTPINYIDSLKAINSLNDLLKELPKGKPIFVDCWATWCSPCVGAFAYNKKLDSLLLSKNIEKLYISIDNPGNRTRWTSMLQKYCLGGYHIIANDKLINDVKKNCNIPDPEHTPILIPRYLIVNKNGVIVENDAISPHNYKQLEEQIYKTIIDK